MRRGKRFFKNENMFIYVGTAIFILLAVGLGVIMYMTTKTGFRIENSEQFGEENQLKTETVISDIGKTVEEQSKLTENDNIVQDRTTDEINETSSNEAGEKENNETPVISKDEEKIIENNNLEEKIIEVKKEITFIMPIEGEIICEYAKDNLIYSETLKEWITHTAIDIKADKTSVIKASADGIIKSIVNDPRYGLTVIIEHDDSYETVYSNLLTAEFVVEGEEIIQGQTIGTAGNTAAFESNMECHVHFELIKDGEYLDPKIYLNF